MGPIWVSRSVYWLSLTRAKSGAPMSGFVVDSGQGSGRWLPRMLFNRPARPSYADRNSRGAADRVRVHTSAVGAMVAAVATVTWLINGSAVSTILVQGQSPRAVAAGNGLASAMLLTFAALLVF